MKLNADVMELYRKTVEALPKSVLVPGKAKQVKVITGRRGDGVVVRSCVGWDDECGNGHNSFSVDQVVSIRKRQDGDPLEWYEREIHPLTFPEFPAFHGCEKWHLFGPDGPMYYLENTIFHADDRDCWGLRKGESRQMHNNKGVPMWNRERSDYKVESLPECPTEVITIKWGPCRQEGEGKRRELDYARSTACWPEATDEQLMLEPNELAVLLINRLPALMDEFHKAVIAMGFTY